MTKMLTVETVVKAPIERVWECWTKPEHIVGWAFASDDWEAPSAENDVRPGGSFKTVMAARDGSATFDFGGTYTSVKKPELLEYRMDDARQVKVEFVQTPAGVRITQTFDPETENPEEVQRSGWQAILDTFRDYAEAHS